MTGASVQAATRVNAEQASKRTTCRPTRQPFRGRLIWFGELSEDDARPLHRGSGGSMYTRKARANQGKPLGAVRDDQPDAREGQAGRLGVAERFVRPGKPGNAGGGKGPQFKTDAISREGSGDWATYQLRKVFRNCRWRYIRKRRLKPVIAFTPYMTRSAAKTSWLMPMLSSLLSYRFAA